MERKRLIKISNNRVFLTPEVSLSLAQTSLKGTNLSFRAYEDIYFEISIIDYNRASHNLIVKVVNYQPKNIQNFNQQIAKSNIYFVEFKPLLWQSIEKYLSSYTKSFLLRDNIVVDNVSENLKEPESSSFSKVSRVANENEKRNPSTVLQLDNKKIKPSINTKPLIETLIEYTDIYFKDADFNLGYIAFSYKSKKLNQTFHLKIGNDFLRKEFNSIRFYFPKVIGGKKWFSVKVVFTITDKVVTDILATSQEIGSINEFIIDSIKIQRVANLTKTPLRNLAGRSLFTAEDIFDSFEEELKNGNIFNQSEQDILNVLIKTREVRNEKHLQYLSGSKQSVKQKLRFTLKPLFGFVFFIEGEVKNHFCWELLNSHATYLWSFEKVASDANFQLQRLEETISIIRQLGRENYKKDYRNSKIDNDLCFCTIEHYNINSSIKDGFLEWQHRLNERIT